MNEHEATAEVGPRSSWDDLYVRPRRAAELSTIPIALTTGAAHVVRYANPAFRALVVTRCGRSDDGCGTRLFAIFDERAPLRDVLDDVLASGSAAAARVEGTAPQGRLTFLVNPIDDLRGGRAGLVVQILAEADGNAAEDAAPEIQEANQRLVLASLREQEQAERSRQLAAQMKALLDNMVEGVTVFDAAGRVVLMNPAGRDTMGLRDERDAEDQPPDDFDRYDFRRLDGQRFTFGSDLLGPLLCGQRFTEEEVLFLRPDGAERHLVFSGSAVRGVSGVRLAIVTYRDVTDLRQLEQIRERYVSLISHDLRGPLDTVKMAAHLIDRGPGATTQQRALLQRIVRGVDRAGGMLHDLLDAHRIRARHPLQLRLAPCDLAAIATEVIEDLTALHGARFDLRVAGSVTGTWSAQELRRALWNLASNAIKYGAPQGRVTVKVEQNGAMACASVHNSGNPIPPREQTGLFDPFARTGTGASGQAGGWGLGLTVVRGCAEAHGGRVTVRSSAEEGTTFTLHVPLDASHPPG